MELKDEDAKVALTKCGLESYARRMGRYQAMEKEESRKYDGGSERYLRGCVSGMRVALEWLGFPRETRARVDAIAEEERMRILAEDEARDAKYKEAKEVPA